MGEDDEVRRRRRSRFVETGEGARVVRPGVGTFLSLNGELVLQQNIEGNLIVSAENSETGDTSASDDLINFWSRLGEENIHPDDVGRIDAPSFATDLHPVPWVGPLRTAKAYFLFLNPGLSEDDRQEEARPSFSRAVRENLSGDKPYLYLLNEHASHPGYKWARQTFGVDITEASASDICMLQLIPYHSKENTPAKRVAPKLPSSLAIRRFVHKEFLPRARRGEIVIVVARSAKIWDITKDEESIIVYKGFEPRRAFQTAKSRGGQLMRQKLIID